jgi:hypothetical protein
MQPKWDPLSKFAQMQDPMQLDYQMFAQQVKQKGTCCVFFWVMLFFLRKTY